MQKVSRNKKRLQLSFESCQRRCSSDRLRQAVPRGWTCVSKTSLFLTCGAPCPCSAMRWLSKTAGMPSQSVVLRRDNSETLKPGRLCCCCCCCWRGRSNERMRLLERCWCRWGIATKLSPAVNTTTCHSRQSTSSLLSCVLHREDLQAAKKRTETPQNYVMSVTNIGLAGPKCLATCLHKRVWVQDQGITFPTWPWTNSIFSLRCTVKNAKRQYKHCV